MSTSLLLPYAQSSVRATPPTSAGTGDYTYPLLPLASCSAYGSCSSAASLRRPNPTANIFRTNEYSSSFHFSCSPRGQPQVVERVTAKVPTPPSSPKSPFTSSVDVSTKIVNKVYSSSRLRKSQSTLIMPNLFNLIKSGPTVAGQSQRPSRTRRQSDMTRVSSSRSLANCSDSSSPDPLIRKCQTMIALSNPSSAASTATQTKVYKEKKGKLGFLRKISSSRSAIFSASRNVMSKSPSNVSSLTKSSSAFTDLDWVNRSSCQQMFPHLEEDTYSTDGQGNGSSVGNGCSRCASVASLQSRGYISQGQDSVFCKLCLNEVSGKETYQLQECQCTFCTYCMSMYVTLKIREGAAAVECPDANCDCRGELLLEEIEGLVGKELFALHLRLRRDREIDLDPYRVWCPTPGCETVIPLSASKHSGHPQCCTCPSCRAIFCASCSSAWHPGQACFMPIQSTECVPLSEVIKRCPKCKVPIERDAGCAQMQCKKCKHVFCWYCLASLEDDFLLRHYDKGPCKNKLGHSRASVLWHRAQVIGIFAGFGLLLLVSSPVFLIIGPCLLCKSCRLFSKQDVEEDSLYGM